MSERATNCTASGVRWLRMVQRHFHAPVVIMYLSEEAHAAETKA